jgi:hypothetical protein
MRQLGFVDIRELAPAKAENQILHPAETAGIRDDMFGRMRLQSEDVNRARQLRVFIWQRL